MRVNPLNLKELLELDPEGGEIRFGGQPALLLDAVAMGLLRKHMVENFGLPAARTALTQFGFAHGWRAAEAIQGAFAWSSRDDWRRAGAQVHSLAGLLRVDLASSDPLSKAGSTLAASYEAEQHLLHFDRAKEPVCWTVTGLISGYLSRAVGEDVLVLEDRCMGKGDAVCHLVGRTREAWLRERPEALRGFDARRVSACLEVSLQRITDTLKRVHGWQPARRRQQVKAAQPPNPAAEIVARSAAMREVVELARRVARVDTTVLITGETGSGKERIARLIHEESARAAGPFVAVNCAAIAESLVESELFGHARGAFSGATKDREGLFESANGGTLLLDEVGEVPAITQVKLLRALQERELRRVGENTSRTFDVRVIAATNRDLTQSVANGGIRQDLYYRLKVVELPVPALRERQEDILPLARLLLEEAASAMKRRISGLSTAAADQLLQHAWPGNVRELENAMRRAAALAPGDRVELEDLPLDIRAPFPRTLDAVGPVRPLARIEREYIIAALTLNGGNRARTAEQLKIGSATLYRKLKRYGIQSGADTPSPASEP